MTDDRADFNDSGTLEAAYERFGADEYADHLEARRDRSDVEVVPDPRPPRRVKRTTAPRPDRLWKERVLERDQGCCVHRDPADCDEGWQAHHVVPQKILRQYAPQALWHTGTGMGVCGLAHRQHHNRVRPITLDEVPEPVRRHIVALGLGWFLERHYPPAGEENER